MSNPNFQESLSAGDHIFTWGGLGQALITHHGIYSGNGEVIHYQGGGVQGVKQPIAKTALEEFLGSNKAGLGVISHFQSLEPEVVVQRALSRLGENKYDVVFNNCEHFAFYCKGDVEMSYQVLTGALMGVCLMIDLFSKKGLSAPWLPGIINGIINEQMRIRIIRDCPVPALSYTAHFRPLKLNQDYKLQ